MIWRRSFIMIAIIGLLAAGAGRGWAGIEHSDSSLATNHTLTILGFLPMPGGDPPAVLPSNHDIYLLVLAGGNYVDVKAIGRPGTSGPALARALESAVRSTSMAGGTVKWSSDVYTIAEVMAQHSWFAMTGSSDVPIGGIAAGLTSAGYRVHPLFRTPMYARVTPFVPTVHSSHFYWHAGASLAAHSTYRVSATVPTRLAACVASLLLVIPTILAGVFFMTVRSAKRALLRPDADVRVERVKFIRMVAMMPALAMMPLAILPALLISNGVSPILADMWFGDTESTAIVPIIILPMVFLFPLMIAGFRKAHVLFGKPDADIHAAMSPEEKKLTQQKALATGLPHLIVIAGIIGGSMFVHGPLGRQLHSLAAPIAMLLASPFVRAYTQRIKAATQSVDDPWTWRAQQIAMHFGARVHAVRIDMSAKGKLRTFVERDGLDLVISEKMVQCGTAAEIDFLVASALAWRKPNLTRPFRWIFVLGLFPLLMVPLIFSHRLKAPGPWLPLVMLAPLIVMLFAILFGSNRRQKALIEDQVRSLTAADMAALEVTKDLAAALSALERVRADVLVSTATTGSSAVDPVNATVVAKKRTARMREIVERAAVSAGDWGVHEVPRPRQQVEATGRATLSAMTKITWPQPYRRTRSDCIGRRAG